MPTERSWTSPDEASCKENVPGRRGPMTRRPGRLAIAQLHADASQILYPAKNDPDYAKRKHDSNKFETLLGQRQPGSAHSLRRVAAFSYFGPRSCNQSNLTFLNHYLRLPALSRYGKTASLSPHSHVLDRLPLTLTYMQVRSAGRHSIDRNPI